jgi:hypothetical protein
MNIKTEKFDNSSCGQSACLNGEESLGQGPGPEDGVSRSVNPLIRIGTKRGLTESELGFSKVKAVSLAAPSICMQVDVKK